MDRDLIRVIIFAIGLLVIVGLIAWSYITHEKNKKNYHNYDDYDGSSTEHDEHSQLGHDMGDYVEHTDAEEEGDTAETADVTIAAPTDNAADNIPASNIKKPNIIQFSIVATNETGFSGIDLFNVLDDAGLEYGNLQIFERLDARRLVDFGVANLVKPGIFPSTNLAAFYSPGIVFFMQSSKVDNPTAVFDDFIRTFKFVAAQLGGEMWDHNREILTEETIAQIRHSISAP